MNPHEFDHLAQYEWERIPPEFVSRIKNVALLIEDEPDVATRKEEGELLGLYRGIPLTERGSEYGVGMTLPDTITLYREPILAEASEMDRFLGDAVRIVIRETLWHELGHYLGLGEDAIRNREDAGSNAFGP